jgi:glycosyltransferase A (GT-A) superfamily protein (DUF2064 family)
MGTFIILSTCIAGLLAGSPAPAQTDARLAEAIGDAPIAEVRALLRTGMDLEARDKKGRTLLALAVAESRSELVWLLLEAGAEVDARDE